MSTIDIQIQEVEAKTLAMLKDFQRATVERIDTLYWHGQKRGPLRRSRSWALL